MDIIHQQQKQREKVGENHQKSHEDERLKQESKQKSITSPASPQSTSSSPSHEFSFTISLHSTTPTSNPTDKTKTSSASPFAIDLSPADDIFFHGQLLPLHFLSHLPVSPRSSTNSLDSFNLPKKDILDEPKKQQHQPEKNACITSHNNIITKTNVKSNQLHHHEIKGRNKSKSLSQIILGLKKWRKGYQERGNKRQEEDKEKHKRKMVFEVSQVIKKYARMVRPLLPFKGKRDDVDQFYDRQSYNSYSGNLSLRRDKQVLIRNKGQYSAPASMSTSPTNSGLLVATSPHSSSTSDSTMEELQSAIQAAIAHCKNSIAKG